MVAAKVKKVLAALNIAGLLAGSGMMAAGCTNDTNKDEPPVDTVQQESEKSEIQRGPDKKAAEPGPDTGKKIRGTSG